MPEANNPDAPEIDGFTHVRVLGSGGFSDVHLYQQRFPRRRVAVKVLKIETLDRELRRQFVAEANVMAQLSTHPAIATIYSADITSDGRPYLVMEYCSGGSLGTAYRTTPHSVEEVLAIGIRVASALESAHRAGVVHRDVKPANILITDYGVPVLTDFGISVGEEGLSESTVFRTEHSTATVTTGNAGTTQGLSVPWAPPEAFDDVPSNDERSDIYSLGATLFSLLEGRSPFELPGGNNSALHLSRRIERGEVVPGTREVPAALTALLMRSIAISRTDRPQTAKEFGMALQDIQKELGLAITPLDLVTVAAAGVSEADQVTRLRPSTKVDTATKHMPEQTTAETQIRQPPPAAAAPIPVATDRRLSRTQLGLIAAISAGVLLLSGTGIAIAFSIINASQAASGQATQETPVSTDAPGGDVEVGSYPTELIPSAFTAVDPSAFADPGFLGSPMSGVHFVSPSLNLGCAITGADNDDLWGCVAAVAWWTWPDGPNDYCYDPEQVVGCGSGIEVDGDGLPHPRRRGDPGFPASVSVNQGNAAPYNLRVLEYGQSVTYGDVTCYSELRGMTCVNAQTQHGFVIAKDLNTIF